MPADKFLGLITGQCGSPLVPVEDPPLAVHEINAIAHPVQDFFIEARGRWGDLLDIFGVDGALRSIPTILDALQHAFNVSRHSMLASVKIDWLAQFIC
jgi:hypothetical protein